MKSRLFVLKDKFQEYLEENKQKGHVRTLCCNVERKLPKRLLGLQSGLPRGMHKRSKTILIIAIAFIAIFVIFVPVVPIYGVIAVSPCLAQSQCGRAYLDTGSYNGLGYTPCTSYNPAIMWNKVYLSISYRMLGVGEVYQAGQGGGYVWSPTKS